MGVGYHFGYQSDMDRLFFWWTTKLFILMISFFILNNTQMPCWLRQLYVLVRI